MITKNKKKIFAFFLTLFVGGGIFFLIPNVYAAGGAGSDWAGEVIGGLIGWIISALGLILVLVMKALVSVAQYSNFIASPAVENGWMIVRDVCNMFFVLILLIIAFATILGIEKYNYKKWLPKLILMAILINFSKTICGLLIDFAQVVMLTFVNAFKDIAAGNLISNLGITDILTLAESDNTVGFWQIVGSYVLGLIYVLIALVVIVTMLAMLVMRIVMLWIYIVLSPLAYLMSSFPDGAKYSSQWWSEFTKNLIIGPVLAFFIWLSFTSLQVPNWVNEDFKINNSDTTSSIADEAGMDTTHDGGADATGTKASTPGVFIKFIIAIGMLIGGLKISQEIGGAAGGIAGKGMAAIQKGKTIAAGWAKSGAKATSREAIMMTAGSKKGMSLLENVAASKNPLLRVTGIRSLATQGLIGVNKKQKEIETKAEEKMKNIKSKKVISRFAQEKAFLSQGKAEQETAADIIPSALGSEKKISEHLANMKEDSLTKISEDVWYAIGAAGVKLEGEALALIQKNSVKRGAYNLGIEQHNADPTKTAVDYERGTDKKGIKYKDSDPDVYGAYFNKTKRKSDISPKKLEKFKKTASYTPISEGSTSYFKESPKLEPEKTTRVEPNQSDSPRGNGNLSINEFAREKSDTIAVDFDKLNAKGIDKGKDADNRNVRGLNTSDPALIKEVSAKMVGMIDQELNKIRSKGADQLTAGDKMRMNNLETAKTKFSKPETIDNLSMVNSSAASYKLSDVKTSKIHEEVHGLGIKDEDDTKYVTQKVLEGKEYDAKTGRTDKNTVDKILADKPKNVPSEKAPVDDVIKREADAEIETESSQSDISVDTANLDKSMENFSKKLEEVSKNFGGSIGAISGKNEKSQPNFTYLFNSLRKAINKQNIGLAKKISVLGGDKASTPLEMEVISTQVADKMNNQSNQINNQPGENNKI